MKLDCELDAPVAALLREVDEQIAPLGARLGIEPSATSGVRDLDEALALIDEIGRPTMGLVIDSWHFFVGGWSMAALGARTSEAVAFVQLADGWPVESPAELATQTMQHRAVPGDGTFDLAGFLAPWFGDPLEEGPGPGPVPVPVCVEVLSAEWRDRPVAELAAAAMTGVRRLL
jgi:sugar phosphate isomerase/epimerase